MDKASASTTLTNAYAKATAHKLDLSIACAHIELSARWESCGFEGVGYGCRTVPYKSSMKVLANSAGAYARASILAMSFDRLACPGGN